jgi:DNA-binding SARP family transcriptional activator
MSHERLSLQILGPLRLWRGGTELDAGPRQQAYLLALLLARAGRPTSTTELIDLVWDDGAPATAVNTVQKYVSALRRLLEPALPVRGASSYLLRRGTGYVLAARSGMVDAHRRCSKRCAPGSPTNSASILARHCRPRTAPS